MGVTVSVHIYLYTWVCTYILYNRTWVCPNVSVAIKPL